MCLMGVTTMKSLIPYIILKAGTKVLIKTNQNIETLSNSKNSVPAHMKTTSKAKVTKGQETRRSTQFYQKCGHEESHF